jgi:hypothetical protein
VNVLLIYPEFPDTFWSFKHALKFIRKRASLPPLGLLTIAAMLPPGWSKRLVDLNVKTLFALAWGLRRELGMRRALERLELPLEGTHHRGVDDACGGAGPWGSGLEVVDCP